MMFQANSDHWILEVHYHLREGLIVFFWGTLGQGHKK